MDVLTVGEGFQDLIFAGLPRLPRRGEELRVPHFSISPGGGALITAVACARLGLRTGTLTAVARSGAAALRAEGVSVINLMRDGEQAAVTVALSMPHDRAFVTCDGVNRHLQRRAIAVLRRLARRPRHVHFALSPRRCAAWIPIVRRLHRRGATTSWDFGWNDRLARDPAFSRLRAEVGWLFLNAAEAKLYRDPLARPNLVVKRGARGAVALVGGSRLASPAVRARVADTTGAGDAFNGGFLAGILRGAPVAQALRVGNYVGARSTEAIGGIDGLPRRRALPRWARQSLEAA